MMIDRRKFLGTLAAAAAAGTLTGIPSLTATRAFAQAARPRIRVAILEEKDFPSIDGMEFSAVVFRRALEAYQLEFAGVEGLSRLLETGSIQVLVTPYGSAFPLEFWPVLQHYLARGGNWLNIGGAPLSVPVVREGEGWRPQVRQTAYHKELGITQIFPVTPGPGSSYAPCNDEAKELLGEFTADLSFALYARLTSSRDIPDEDGSAGPREAVLRPLIHAVVNGIPVAAPIVAIDRLQGRFGGGRWVFAAFRGTLTPNGIRYLVDSAAENASELLVRPSYARFRPGESVSFAASLVRPKNTGAKAPAGECAIEIADEHGNSVAYTSFALREKKGIVSGQGPLPFNAGKGLPTGFYHARAKATLRYGFPGGAKTLTGETGFWVVDDSAIRPGDPLTSDGTYLYRAGKPLPVTGTTYMASDVHRKFLQDPNPLVWDHDFATMKRSGVNVVRTGLWTGWKSMTAKNGTPKEEILRAMDAFVLTAQKHDMPLIFTLFAFLPETWGGDNPYLDPRSLAAQKVFVEAFARRYAGAEWVMWDLINEPSFCSPKHLWFCRPNYDDHERREWESWLRRRYQAPSDALFRARLCELWRTTPDEGIGLPALQDFEDANLFGERRPARVTDYMLFAQEMFTGWVKEISSALRSHGNPRQLITVGQDEGGTLERPSPAFHARAVDFTSVHTWWFNDDILWDGIVTKSPGVPNLVEETGVMFTEKTDGSAWRNEHQAARLLERKLALAFAGGGAGFIEWIWNTNPYMNSDNEAAIGLFRPDGTAKPEFASFAGISQWIGSMREHFREPEPATTVMILPQSLTMSVRNQATAATRGTVRALCYRCGVPVRAVGEYQAAESLGHPPLIVIPAPSLFTRTAWDAVLANVDHGSTLVITGYFDADEHGLPTGRMAALGIECTSAPVTTEELARIDEKFYRVSYRGEKLQRVEKAVVADAGLTGPVIARGNGKIVWSPLPLELNDESEPIVSFYRAALRESGFHPVFTRAKTDGPSALLILPLLFAGAALYILVSEGGVAETAELTHEETGFSFSVDVAAGGTAMVLVSRREREEISRWPG